MKTSEKLTIKDYEEAFKDHQRLVRKIDVIMNGEEGAAPQASLCDLINQIQELTSSKDVDLSALDCGDFATQAGRIALMLTIGPALGTEIDLPDDLFSDVMTMTQELKNRKGIA